MAAPSGLLFAKLLIPETDTPAPQLAEASRPTAPSTSSTRPHREPRNGLKLALNVGAMLIAFIGLIALVNGALAWLGALLGADSLSLQGLLGYLFSPVAWLLGLPWSEALQGGALIGQKIVLNEFVAFAAHAVCGCTRPTQPCHPDLRAVWICQFRLDCDPARRAR